MCTATQTHKNIHIHTDADPHMHLFTHTHTISDSHIHLRTPQVCARTGTHTDKYVHIHSKSTQGSLLVDEGKFSAGKKEHKSPSLPADRLTCSSDWHSSVKNKSTDWKNRRSIGASDSVTFLEGAIFPRGGGEAGYSFFPIPTVHTGRDCHLFGNETSHLFVNSRYTTLGSTTPMKKFRCSSPRNRNAPSPEQPNPDNAASSSATSDTKSLSANWEKGRLVSLQLHNSQVVAIYTLPISNSHWHTHKHTLSLLYIRVHTTHPENICPSRGAR